MRTSTVLVWLLTALIAGVACAGERPSCCPKCGCTKTRKVCKLVCGMKEDIDYEYDVDCDDYCLPAKSDICGKKWVPDCKSLFGLRKALIWQPHCGCKIHTRKTLVKIPVVKKVPAYNCVVECVCCRCGTGKVDAEATAQARAQGIMPNSVDAPIVLDSGEPLRVLASSDSRGAQAVPGGR